MQMATSSTEGIWTSPAMTAVLRVVARVGPTHLSVLITGESGTGKEVVARALHRCSTHSAAPMVVVDCAAIAPNLLESELFGHIRGAFTGASESRLGLVARADGGTFFLDEIGELSPAVQVKLLRLLEDGSYRAVGDPTPRSAQIRVIAATNRDLDTAVRTGVFRADLFHRLNGCRVHLPPLRERPEDVRPLLEHHINRFAQELGRAAPTLGRRAAHALQHATWPGNVRQLVNCAQYVASLCEGPVIELSNLPSDLQTLTPEAAIAETAMAEQATPTVADLPYAAAKRQVLDAFEGAYLEALLDRHGGNISASARAAGMDRKTIQRMLKRHTSEG